jgi:hypothetical protein
MVMVQMIFPFFNSSFDFYMATPWWSYWTRQDIVAYLPDEKLELAGLKHYVYYSSHTIFIIRYVLSNNVIIKDDLNFNDASFQAIAERTYYHEFIMIYYFVIIAIGCNLFYRL